jgi:thioredoxin-like negative regulator of GroEL
MSNRFLANILVLLIFGLGFFGVTFAINWFAYSEELIDHEFSFERRTADKYVDEHNWTAAARYYGQLAQFDPENAGACVSKAWCLAQMREQFLSQIRQQMRSNSPDQSIIDNAKVEANLASIDAIEAYEQVLEFPQFRNDARFRLALMNSFAGEKEKALRHLTDAIEDGYKPRNSINNYLEFQPLLTEPEFQALIRKNGQSR